MTPVELSNAEWAVMAQLAPRLRSGTEVFRHLYRGTPWYVVKDPVTGRHHRFAAGTYRIVGALDGSLTLDDLHARLEAELGDDAPSRAEVVGVVAQLRVANLLEIDVRRDAAALFERVDRIEQSRWVQILMRPLSIKIPLMDPDAWLTRLAPLARLVFSVPGALVWLALVCTALVLAVDEADALAAFASARMGDPAVLLTLYMVFPSVKFLHELGHGLALKRWGVQSHECGVMLLALVPVPFIDASAANALADRKARMVIGAAGMLVETAVAAIALLVWLVTEPGYIKDVSFLVALIGGVSTLVFNANPLLRYDGYYVLTDAVQIPALATRANAFYGWLARRFVLGARGEQSPVTARGETPWFACYAPAALAYRWVVMLAIALWLSDAVPLVGPALAFWLIVSALVWPALRPLRYVLFSPQVAGARLRGIAIAGCITAALAFVVLTLPVPSHTSASGYVLGAEASQLRAAQPGVVVGVFEPDGADVAAGDVLFQLEDVQLEATVRELRARVAELEMRRTRAARSNPGDAKEFASNWRAARDELAEHEGRAEALTVKAPHAGRLHLIRPSDQLARYVEQGGLLALVIPHEPWVVRTAISQDRIALVRARTHDVRVRIAPWPQTVFPASVVRSPPAAASDLARRALGSQGGGDIAVDASDEAGRRVLEPVFEVDLAIAAPGYAVEGMPARIRFEHVAEPLGAQALRVLRQTFLTHLDI